MRTTTILAGTLLAAGALAACGTPPPPPSLVLAFDGSRSASGLAADYLADAELLLQQQADVEVSAITLSGSSGDSGSCPPAGPVAVVSDAGNDQARDSDRTGLRAQFLAAAADTAVCASNLGSSSDLVAFERLRAALPHGGTAVLYCDGIISARDFGLKRSLLTNPTYRRSVVARFAAGADISGITVHVRGAGIGSGYTATQLTGLRLLWDELVASHGGTLAEFTADLSS